MHVSKLSVLLILILILTELSYGEAMSPGPAIPPAAQPTFFQQVSLGAQNLANTVTSFFSSPTPAAATPAIQPLPNFVTPTAPIPPGVSQNATNTIAVPPGPQTPPRDGRIPIVNLEENLNLQDNEYPCLSVTTPPFVAGDCSIYYREFWNGSGYGTSRTASDELTKANPNNPNYRQSGINFGSKFKIHLSPPPSGGTCKLFQSVNSGWVEVQSPFNGIADYSSNSSMSAGKSLTFKIACTYPDLTTRNFTLALSAASQLKKSALLLESNIPAPLLRLIEVVQGSRSLIDSKWRDTYLTSNIPVITDLSLINSMQSPNFGFMHYLVTVPRTFPATGILEIPNHPMPFASGAANFASIVANGRTYVFVRGFFSNSAKYKLYTTISPNHECGYKASMGQTGYAAFFKTCFLASLEREGNQKTIASISGAADFGGRFIPIYGGLYSAAELVAYGEPTQMNYTIAGFLAISSVAGPISTVCKSGTYARTAATTLYWGSETMQAGISGYQIASSNGNGGDVLALTLLLWQGGRLAASRSVTFSYLAPPNTNPKTRKAIADGLDSGTTDIPSDLHSIINNLVGPVQNGKVSNASLKTTIENTGGTSQRMMQIAHNGVDDLRQGVAPNEISIIRDDGITCPKSKACSVSLQSSSQGFVQQFQNYSDLTKSRALNQANILQQTRNSRITEEEMLIIAQRTEEIERLAQSRLGKHYDDLSQDEINALNGYLTSGGVYFSGANSINQLSTLTSPSVTHQLHRVMAELLTFMIKNFGLAGLKTMPRSQRIQAALQALDAKYSGPIPAKLRELISEGLADKIAAMGQVGHQRYRSLVRQLDPSGQNSNLSNQEAQELVNAKGSFALNSTGTSADGAAKFWSSKIPCGSPKSEIVLIRYPAGSNGTVINGDGPGAESGGLLRQALHPEEDPGDYVHNEIVINTPVNGWIVNGISSVQASGRKMWLIDVVPAP